MLLQDLLSGPLRSLGLENGSTYLVGPHRLAERSGLKKKRGGEGEGEGEGEGGQLAMGRRGRKLFIFFFVFCSCYCFVVWLFFFKDYFAALFGPNFQDHKNETVVIFAYI